jgi:TonB family protein
MPSANRPVSLPLALACVAGWAAAQTAVLRPDGSPPADPALRAEAVRLLERANRVSIPSVWLANEMTLRFHVTSPAPGDPYDGEYVCSVGGDGLRRQYWHYGAYEHTLIRNGQRVGEIGPRGQQPVAVRLATALVPIYLIRFDNQDVIRSIRDTAPDARCVQFDTISGDRLQSNEVCVDPHNGWLLSVRTGDTLTRNSNFFPFQDAFFPGHIERWSTGRKVIEIDHTLVLKSDYPEDYFTPPEGSTSYICQQFRRAFEVNTPQPPAGSSIQITDIRLQGLIGANGQVSNLKPLESSHPDLNEEAVKLVSTWTFQPATCDGRPVIWGSTFTVHFKGR